MSLFADNVNQMDSYNLNCGIKALASNNIKEALGYFQKEISEHPDNGYAYAWLANALNIIEEFDDALTAVNFAIKNISSKDKKSFVYATRARIYLNLKDTIQALRDFESGINITPNDGSLYEYRAQTYSDMGEYELSNRDYRMLISMKDKFLDGYLGLGINATKQRLYEEAIMYFDHIIKLVPSNLDAYWWRSYCYIDMKKYNEALDDVINVLAIGKNGAGSQQLLLLADIVPILTVEKLKNQKQKEPNEDFWIFYLGTVYSYLEKYEDAITVYKEGLTIKRRDLWVSEISECYTELGQYDLALEYCIQAIALNPAETDYLKNKVILEEYLGLYKEAIADMTDLLEKKPNYAWGYYKRGKLKNEIGEKDMARADFLEAVRIDSIPEQADCAPYAYLYLGEHEKAIEIMNAILKADDKESHYEAACLYSLMGEELTSLFHLRKALEKGFRRFAHMEKDCDLNNIRNTNGYISLIEEYRKNK